MPTVDNKIVSMEFDNGQFENGVATSLQTIALLKQQLNNLSSTTSFDSLTQESSKFNFGLNTMATGLKGLSDSFSSLGIIGIAALSRITNSAIDAASNLVKSLTIAPVSAGWTKYEQAITATKTIMNATNKPMVEVEKQLDRLRFFADETSYSISDMSDAVGKFTANGQDLQKSVTAVQGIATWAATSGQNTQTANAVMYQLSQAVGAGMIRSQDWKSVETMNMATEEFKQNAINTAIAMGKLTKAGKTLGKNSVQVNTKNFKSTLEKDWFTADVFIKTLTKYGSYADDVYAFAEKYGVGAADAMEQMKDNTDVFGKKVFVAAQEAKTLTDAINATKDAVSSGWALTGKLIFGNYEEARILFTDLAGVMNEVFASGGRDRNKMLIEWKELGGRTVLLEALANAWNNLKDAIKPVADAWNATFPPITGQVLYNITVAFRKLTDSFKMGGTVSNNLFKAMKAIFGIIDLIINGIGLLIKKIFELAGGLEFSFDVMWEGIGWFAEAIIEFTAAVKSGEAFAVAMAWVKRELKKLEVVLEPVISYLTQLYDKINEMFTTGSLKGVGDFFRGMAASFTSFITSITTGFNTRGLDGAKKFAAEAVTALTPMEKIGKVLEKIFGGIKAVIDFFVPILSAVAGVVGFVLYNIFAKIGELISGFTLDGFFEFVNNILKSGVLVGVIALSFKLVKVGDSVSATLKQVQSALQDWQNNLKAKTIMTLALAMGVLTASILVLSMIDVGKLGKALAAMSIMFVELMWAFQVFAKSVKDDNAEKIIKVAAPLMGLAVAIFFLSLALAKMSGLNFPQIATGLLAIWVMLEMLVKTSNKFRATAKNLKPVAFSLILFASAIWILSKPVMDMASIPFNRLAGALAGMSLIFFLVEQFYKKIGMSKKLINPQVLPMLFGLALAMNGLAAAVMIFGRMDPLKLLQGMVAFGLVGLGLAVFIKKVGSPANIVKTAFAMSILGGAMLIFTGAVAAMGAMSDTGLIQGLMGVAVGLALMGVTLSLLASKGTDIVIAAAGIFLVASALAVLAPVLLLFSLMSLPALGMALLALAGIFAVFGVATIILSFVAIPMLVLGAAMLMVGLATVTLGIGLQMLSLAFIQLALTAPLGGGALILVLTSLILLIPLMLVKIAEGIVAFVIVIGEGATAIAVAFDQVFTAILTVLFAKKLIVIRETLNFVIALLQVLYDAMPTIVALGIGIMVKFMDGFTSQMDLLVNSAVNMINAFIDAMSARLGDIIDTGIRFIVSWVQGMADGIKKNSKEIGQAVWDLICAIVGAIWSFIGTVKDSAIEVIDEWTGGLGTAIEDAWNGIVSMGKSVITAIIDGIGKMGGALWDGAVETVKNAVDGIAKWLGIKSPSKKTTHIGEMMGEGLIVGIDKTALGVVGATTNLGKEGVTGLSKSMAKMADSMDETTATFTPTIAPVVDMTNFDNSLKEMTKATAENGGVFNVKSLFSMSQAKASTGAILSSTPNTGNDTTDALTKGAAIILTQNNYSPKALSRLDIYRQTKNQFSALKGLVTQ